MNLVWWRIAFFKPRIFSLGHIDLLYAQLCWDKCSVTDWTASCEVNVLERWQWCEKISAAGKKRQQRCDRTIVSIGPFSPSSERTQSFKSLKSGVALLLFDYCYSCMWCTFEYIYYNMWEQHKWISFHKSVSCIQYETTETHLNKYIKAFLQIQLDLKDC